MIQWLLKKFGYQKAKGHILTDEDRARAIETNKLKAQVKNLERQAELMVRLSKVNEVFNPKKKPEEMLMQIIMAKMMSGQVQPMQQEQPQENTYSVEYSDDQIDMLLEENKKYVKFAKTMPDEQIKEHIRKIAPRVGDDTIQRTINKIRCA